MSRPQSETTERIMAGEAFRVRVPKSLAVGIRRIAWQKHMPVSRMIRWAIEEFIASHALPTDDRVHTGTHPTERTLNREP